MSRHSVFPKYSVAFSLLSSALGVFYLTPTVQAQTANLSRLVVVGDSLSAGVQNISLLDTQQPHGYAALVAKQANVPLVLPLVARPGIPNVLQINGFNPLPVIGPAPGTLPAQPRDNPGEQPTNLAEPGTTVAGALAPPSLLPPPVGPWATIVLESPTFQPPNIPSQVQEAVALNPTSVILWLGNNDALVPALVGAISGLTPLPNFTGAFNTVINSLAAAPRKPTLIVANIPDVTEVPFFTSVQSVARVSGIPAAFLASALGTGTGDYLRSSALPIALNILTGQTKGPLPAVCPAPYPGFPSTAVPCVLKASDAATVRASVDGYNEAIAAAVATLNKARPHSAILVDIHSLVNQVYINGYQVPGRELTAGLYGGLFSLDGIHPTNTGYAIIANEFIKTMNSELKTGIPAVDVNEVAEQDPLVFFKGLGILEDKKEDKK